MVLNLYVVGYTLTINKLICKRNKTKKMKNFKYIILFISIITFQISTAQQDPNFTLYNFNMSIINPAYSGSNEFKQLNLGYRSQWIGVADAPNTQVLTYTTPLKNNLGFGISIVRDQVFVLQETDITVDVSYKLKVAETYDVYFGLKGGGSIINIDLTRANNGGNDPLFGQNQSFINAQFGAGALLKHEDFYISISTPNFLNGRRYVKQGNAPNAAVDKLHMYYGGGYYYDVSEELTLSPAIMIRSTSGAPTSTDVNLTADYNNIKAGVNYRVGEMYSVFGMFNIFDNLRFGMAYDFIASDLNQINDNGSMEMMIRYQF